MNYEYKCKKCGKVFELKRKISEVKKIEKCIFCGGEAIKQLSMPQIIFKGNGWADKNIKKYKKDKEIDEMAYLSSE